MKKLTFIIILAGAITLQAQLKNTYSASAYYTYGSYSNSDYSTSVKVGGTVGFKSLNFLTVNYDQVKIENPGWFYDQSVFSVAYEQNYYPFYFYLTYTGVSGKYTDKSTQLFSKDIFNIFSAKLIYNYGLNFISAGMNYQILSGFNSLKGSNYKLSYTRLIGLNATLSGEYQFSQYSDGRNFSSFGINASYEITSDLMVFADAAFGERLYYYDENALTIYNQIYIQKNSYGMGVYYSLDKYANLFMKVSRLSFDEYQINYGTLGLTINL